MKLASNVNHIIYNKGNKGKLNTSNVKHCIQSTNLESNEAIKQPMLSILERSHQSENEKTSYYRSIAVLSCYQKTKRKVNDMPFDL